MSISMAALLVIFSCGALTQMIMGSFYGLIVHDARYGTCSSEFMKGIRKKFDGHARLGIKPENVAQYVERELENYEFFGITVNVWNRMAKALIYLGMIMGLMLTLWFCDGPDDQLMTLGFTFIGGFTLEVIGEVFGCMDGKRRAIVATAYHLEYSLAHRDNMKEAVAIDFQKMKEKMEEIEASTYDNDEDILGEPVSGGVNQCAKK